MKISLIAAMTPQRVIGIDNHLPWHLPADLKHFKALTLNKPILMGRLTYESIGKPLPQRHNIVLTHNPCFSAPGCDVVTGLEEALSLAEPAEELMVIGGSQIYQACIDIATRMYLTLVDADLKGHSYFPDYDPQQWQVIAREDYLADKQNPYGYHFLTLARTQNLPD